MSRTKSSHTPQHRPQHAPYDVRPQGLAGRLACRMVAGLDRLGGRLGLGHHAAAPLSAELSRRSLWGLIPRRPAEHPAGRPLLALTFDLDYQADTDALPALVELADRVGAKMTLFSIGKLVEADPGPYREALQAGHEIANHTWSHPDNPVLNPDREFWDLTVDEMADEIGRAQDVFERELGARPVGFRTPHFKDAPRMMEALARYEELRYVSTALASKTPLATPYFPTRTLPADDLSLHYASLDPQQNHRALMIPLTPCPEHRWSPFCSYHAIREPSNPARGAGLHTLTSFASLWTKMLVKARPDGFASVYFDPLDVMRDDETAAVFEAMLRQAADEGWTLTSLDEIERAWRPFLTQPEATSPSTLPAL